MVGPHSQAFFRPLKECTGRLSRIILHNKRQYLRELRNFLRRNQSPSKDLQTSLARSCWHLECREKNVSELQIERRFSGFISQFYGLRRSRNSLGFQASKNFFFNIRIDFFTGLFILISESEQCIAEITKVGWINVPAQPENGAFLSLQPGLLFSVKSHKMTNYDVIRSVNLKLSRRRWDINYL